MAVTPSEMPPLGTRAPDFSLPDTEGNQVSLADFDEHRGLVVVFMCNHCPFVKHLRGGLADFAREYRERGVAMVAINSNDIHQKPEDGPEAMAREREEQGYVFPYLFDETQEVAKAYRAACTPDFFLFDEDRKLFYAGQFDGSRPGNDVPVTGDDLRQAADALLAGEDPPEGSTPSMGCNIKWRPGNAPDYAGV